MVGGRRAFLTDVGTGMVVASVGSTLATDWGLSTAFASNSSKAERLTFGPLERLVALMQETNAEKITALVIGKFRQGTPLRDLVAAAALANARAFGGEDYVGFHTMMALAPGYHMALECSEAERLLPFLKVVHRNARRIQEFGGSAKDVLHPVVASDAISEQPAGMALKELVRRRDLRAAERLFAGAATNPHDALNTVLPTVYDATEVHRVVMPYRAWDLAGIIGIDHAYQLLRQSVRYCIRAETSNYVDRVRPNQQMLAKLHERYRLGQPRATKAVDDGWIEAMSQTLFTATPEQAAEIAAAALAEGMAPDALGEAIALAANQLVLRDPGRTKLDGPGKPPGSIHGDSIGVHASDSANAWRNLARVSNRANADVGLVLGAYQVAMDRVARGGSFLQWGAYPLGEHLTKVTTTVPEQLLARLDDAIRQQDQANAAALVHRYAATGAPANAVFAVLRQYAISEDGALHAEKYYRTVVEEFHAGRPAFRWRHVMGLARVTASEFGQPAPGMHEAREMLKLGKVRAT